MTRLALAYGAGLAAGLVFLPPWGVGLILGGVSVCLWSLESRGREVLVLAVAVGLMAGRAAAVRQSHECAHAWRPGHHAAWVTLDEPASAGGRAGVTVTWSADGCHGELDARFPEASSEHPTPSAGSTLVVVGVLDDIARFQVRHWRALPGPRPWLASVRAGLTGRIERLYGPRAPLVQALVLGRRDDVSKQMRDEFANSGLAHLLAIAGLHVGILVTWVMLLVSLASTRRTALGAATLLAWWYVTLLGFPPPATRAAAFITIRMLSVVRQRNPAPSATLAVAALVVLTIDPAAIVSAGFWLSVSAVGGMGWLMEGGRTLDRFTASGSRVGSLLKRSALARGAAQLTLGSVAATLFTAPVSAYAFGSVAPVGVLANMIAIPLAGLAVPAVFLSLFAPMFAPGAGLALAAIERVATMSARLPGGHVTGSPGVAFALPWILLVAIVVWLRRDRPTAIIARQRVLVAGAGVAWGVFALVSVPRPTSHGLAIHVLDVGQGDGIAIETPHGHWILIDAGPRTPERDAGRDVVVPFLKSQGVDHLDLSLTTHTDADHLGGMPYVLRTEHPDLVLDNGQPVGTALYLDYERVLGETHSDFHAARRGDSLTIDSVTLTVLSPSAEWMASRLETNANSVVVRLTYGGFSALLTGDMDSVTEMDALSLAKPVDLLKVAHHGSNTSSSAVWLDRIHPAAAVISVGANNHYHHPSPETLLKLMVRHIPYWRTDQGGAVTIRSDGRYFVIDQGNPPTWLESFRCLLLKGRPSSASSLSSRACTPRTPAVSFPASSATSPGPPRP